MVEEPKNKKKPKRRSLGVVIAKTPASVVTRDITPESTSTKDMKARACYNNISRES